jgi:hypothetical protein
MIVSFGVVNFVLHKIYTFLKKLLYRGESEKSS